MEVHSVQNANIEAQIKALKEAQVKPKKIEPFVDPIREFARVSRYEGMVRGWLTYPIEERKRIIKDSFVFQPRIQADPASGVKGETEEECDARQLERWRALCVIIQEESRAKPQNRSPEVAIAALKHLFPEHQWKAPAPQPTK